MPNVTDPLTGEQVWDGSAIPASGRESIRREISELAERVSDLEIIDAENTADISFADTPYSILATDAFVLVDLSGGDVVVNLPQVSTDTKKVVTVKIDDDGTGNTCIITPFGAQTIDDETEIVFGTKYESYTLLNDEGSAAWHIIDHYDPSDPLIASSSNILSNSAIAATANVIGEGDSLTQGAGLVSPSTQNWLAVLSGLSNFAGRTFNNFAVSGNFVADVAARYVASVRPLRPSVTGIPAYLYLCIGSNDLWSGTAASVIYAAISSYVSTARGDGFYVIVFNIPDRENFTLAARVQKNELNRLLLESPVGDAFHDIASLFSNYDDTTILQNDGIHPNAAGATLWAYDVNRVSQWGNNYTGRSHHSICAGKVRADVLSLAAKIQAAPLTVGGSFDATNGNIRGQCESAANDAWTMVVYPRTSGAAGAARSWMQGTNVGTSGAWEWAVSASNSTAPSTFVMRITNAGRLQALLGADITGAVDVTNGHLKIQPVDGGLDAAIITMYPKATSPDSNSRSWSFGPNIGTSGAFEWAVSTTAGGAPATFALRITKDGLLSALLGASITGTLTVSGPVVTTPQALSGAGAVNLTTGSTSLTTTGAAQALTLADGSPGQIKTICHVVDGGSAILTPTTKSGYTTITFTNVGDSVTLQFHTTAGWCITGIFGAVAA